MIEDKDITELRKNEARLREEKIAVLERIFPGKQLGDHDWNLDNGVCDRCGKKFYKRGQNESGEMVYYAVGRMCSVVTQEEVDAFRNW